MSFDLERIKLKHHTYMHVAKAISLLGTCKRLKVGAVILRIDGSVASTGYNGAPHGMKHCTYETCNTTSRCIHTVHAEENALRFATGELLTIYITHEPCLNCTRDLAMRGIKTIMYELPYTSIPDNEKLEREEIMTHFNISLIELINDTSS